jgi:hypothetical protein
MTRQFANAVSTTLSAAMASTDTTMTVVSASGFPASYPFDVHIEAETTNTDEIVQVTSLSSGTTYNVTRASEPYGGVQSASAHSSGANVRLVVTAGALAENRPLTTTGDLQTFNGTVPARLPVGANGTVLTADSTQTLGVKWAARELDYAQITSSVYPTATTEASSTPIVTGNAVTYDGSTPVLVEFFAPCCRSDSTIALTVTATVTVGSSPIGVAITPDGAYAYVTNYGSNNVSVIAAYGLLVLNLFDGSSAVGRLGLVMSTQAPVRVACRITPAAGSHTYSIRGQVNAGTGVVSCGPGGPGQEMPAYLRISRAT